MNYPQKKINYVIDFLSNFIILLLPLAFILGNAAINIFLILFIFLFIISTIIERDFIVYNNIYLKVLLFFWAYLIFNSIFINYSDNSLIKSFAFLRFILLPFAIVYFFQKKIFNEKIIFYFYIAVFSFISIDILFQFISGTNIFGFVPKMCLTVSEFFLESSSLKFNIVNIIDEPNTSGQVLINCERYSGIFDDELIAGSFLLLFALPFLIFLMNFNKKIKYSKILFLISSLLIILASIFTGDRAPILILILAIIFLFLFYKTNLKKKIIFAALIFLVFSFSIYFTPHLKHRFIKWPTQILFSTFQNTGVVNNKTDRSALDIFLFETQWGLHYLTAYDIAKKKIFFGHGVRSFRYECKDYDINFLKSKYLKSFDHKKYVEGPKTGCSTHPHNVYLELLAEIGIVGLLIFIIFLFMIIFRIYPKNKVKNDIIFISIFAILISLLFPLKPTGSFFSTWNGYIMWIIIGFYLYWSEIKFVKSTHD